MLLIEQNRDSAAEVGGGSRGFRVYFLGAHINKHCKAGACRNGINERFAAADGKRLGRIPIKTGAQRHIGFGDIVEHIAAGGQA